MNKLDSFGAVLSSGDCFIVGGKEGIHEKARGIWEGGDLRRKSGSKSTVS